MPHDIHDALLIYNLMSGRKRHRRFGEVEQAARFLRDAGIATELAPTTGAGSATHIARLAVEQRRGMVIACGGDGTINEIVNGLAGSRVPMALLPAGTANILAKELEIPWDIPKAARMIPTGIVRRIAVGIALAGDGNRAGAIPPEGRYFLLVAGAGPDGAIVNSVNEEIKKNAGIVAYWIEGLRQLVYYKFPELSIRSEGQERRATMIVVGRTAHYGGPFKITTGASLFEDSFEMLTNAKRGRFGYMECLPALWLGKLRSVRGIEAWKTTEAICEATGTEPIYAQVDGEPIGPLPVTFRLLPDALSLVVPAPPEPAS
jgi:YegS/Rv2252/BmrU family lipid kinase